MHAFFSYAVKVCIVAERCCSQPLSLLMLLCIKCTCCWSLPQNYMINWSSQSNSPCGLQGVMRPWFDFGPLFACLYCMLARLSFFSLFPYISPPLLTWHPGRTGCRMSSLKATKPGCKKWVVGCWHGYLFGARCRLAYSPADATAIQSLASLIH